MADKNSIDSNLISWSQFENVDIRVGMIIKVEEFSKARVPSFKLTIDFGPVIGVKRSSAHLPLRYKPEELIGRQVFAVVNFPPKQIANFISEVLVLGVPDAEGEAILVGVDRPVPLGGRLF